MKVMDTGTPAAAISSASFQASVPCWRTTRKPNSSRSRNTVAMSLWRCVWYWTMRSPASTSANASMRRFALGRRFVLRPAPLDPGARLVVEAAHECGRPGPACRETAGSASSSCRSPSSSRRTRPASGSSQNSQSSTVRPPSRSLRYTVWPDMRCPDPGITFTVVMPPARARQKPSERMSMESRARTSGCNGEEPSPPDAEPTWEWLSTRPGSSTRPVRSCSTAPGGVGTSGPPTSTMAPPRTTSTPASIAGPAIGTTGGAPEDLDLVLRRRRRRWERRHRQNGQEDTKMGLHGGS